MICAWVHAIGDIPIGGGIYRGNEGIYPTLDDASYIHAFIAHIIPYMGIPMMMHSSMH
jgi:hypothetical protein